MGMGKWDVKDYMQSRQDYIIAVKEKRRDTDSEGYSGGCGEEHRVAPSCAELHVEAF